MARCSILVLLAAGVVSLVQSKVTYRQFRDMIVGLGHLPPPTYRNVTVNETEIVFALMTHHHGQEPPSPPLYAYMAESDRDGAMPLLEEWDTEELTDVGKRTAYKLGEFIRRRYGHLLGPEYNVSKIYIRTADKQLPAMTVLTAMAGVYPAKHTWSDKVNWNPVPYVAVPEEYDFLLSPMNCPVVKDPLLNKLKSPNLARFDQFAELITNISKVIGRKDIIGQPFHLFAVYDAYTSLINLGYKVKDEMLALMPGLKAAVDEATDYYHGDLNYYRVGPMLDEFDTYVNQIIRFILHGQRGKYETPRLRVFSGYDINVYGLVAASKAKPRQGYPKHGSLFSLELRRDKGPGGEYFVLPVYLSEPGAEEVYLSVEGCGGPSAMCNYRDFVYTHMQDMVAEHTWFKDCHIDGPFHCVYDAELK